MPKISKTPPGYEFITSAGGIEEYRLKNNGLRVLIMEDHSFPVTGFMITYFVGSKDEATGQTGAAHLLEHMAFKGMESKNGEDFGSAFERVGGDLNGTTWADRTNYFEILPPEHVELAVEAEAGRMKNVKITPKNLKKEMVVVRNELEWGENSPEMLLERAVWATAFQAHPYGHLTIGWRSDVENIDAKTLQSFYDSYYNPNNAAVTIIGNIDTRKTLTKIKKHFEPIPKEKEPPRILTTEPPQRGPRRAVVRKKASTNLVCVSYKMPSASQLKDVYPLQIFEKILSDGVTSLLYQTLVEPAVATEVSVDAHAFLKEGLFQITATLAPGEDHDKVEKVILETIEKVQKNGINKDQIETAKAKILSESAFEKDDIESALMELNEHIAVGDWKEFVQYPKKMKNITKPQVERVVREFLIKDKKTTVFFVAQ